jgi:hypothetical protein
MELRMKKFVSLVAPPGETNRRGAKRKALRIAPFGQFLTGR